MRVVAKAKKWGNSLGLIIPKQAVDSLGILEEQEVVLDLQPVGRSDVLKKAFGTIKKGKKTAQEWKDEFRRTLYKDY